MRTSHTLRLYANPLRVLFLGIVFGAFTMLGVWLVRDSGGEFLFAAAGWIFLVVFGCATAIMLLQLVRDGVWRRPLLQIDDQGWSSRPTLFIGKRTAHWQDIEHIGIYRQYAGQYTIVRTTNHLYYLVVHAKEPAKAARVSIDPFAMRFYPTLHEAMMLVPLNSLFLHTTPDKVEEVLQQILDIYAVEITSYGIQASTEIESL
jgi:hypothetical protein